MIVDVFHISFKEAMGDPTRSASMRNAVIEEIRKLIKNDVAIPVLKSDVSNRSSTLSKRLSPLRFGCEVFFWILIAWTTNTLRSVKTIRARLSFSHSRGTLIQEDKALLVREVFVKEQTRNGDIN